MNEVVYNGELKREFGFFYNSNPYLNRWLEDQGVEADTKYVNEDTKKVTWAYRPNAELRKHVDTFRVTQDAAPKA